MAALPPSDSTQFTTCGYDFAVSRFPELHHWSDEELLTLWRSRWGNVFTILIPSDVFVDRSVAAYLSILPEENAFDVSLTLHAFMRKLLGRLSTHQLLDNKLRISFTLKNEGD